VNASAANDDLSVFVSYARESAAHADWVRRLADSLEALPSFHVVFDQYDLHGGKDLTHFMDRGLASDRIVVVVTPEYVRKAALRESGVGYESSVISADLLANQVSDRFVPALRQGADRPAFLRSKVYIDFRNDNEFDAAVDELAKALRGVPRAARPVKKQGIAGAAPEPLSELVYARPENDAPAGLLGQFDALRPQLRSVSRAVQDFADLVDGLRNAGRWSSTIGCAMPPELSSGELDVRKAVRSSHDAIEDAIRRAEDTVPVTTSEHVRTKLTEIVAALTAVMQSNATATQLILDVRGGLTVHGLSRDGRYAAMIENERQVRSLFRQYADMVRR